MHRRRSLPAHPNGMTFAAYDAAGAEIALRTYYSVGGGFVVDEEATGADRVVVDETPLRFPFTTGARAARRSAQREGLAISDVMLANERPGAPRPRSATGMLHLWSVMEECVRNGYSREGVLPGGLRVPRRAPAMYRDLIAQGYDDPLHVMDWVNLYALSVNEENASGGRIVTAPTNGAAGHHPGGAALLRPVRVAAPTTTASSATCSPPRRSGSCSRPTPRSPAPRSAARARSARRARWPPAGSPRCSAARPAQVENAAEVGIEHNLGLTCDPVGGLVQIPCIERIPARPVARRGCW